MLLLISMVSFCTVFPGIIPDSDFSTRILVVKPSDKQPYTVCHVWVVKNINTTLLLS
jgi:hypothetical protein